VDLTTASGKSQFVQEILPTLSKIGDPIQRRHYIGRAAGMIRVRESDIEEALRQFERTQRRSAPQKKQSPTSPPPVPPPVSGSGPESPPDDAVLITGSSEEPPLWTNGPLAETPEPKTAPPQPVAQAQTAAIGPEEHLLGIILYHHRDLLAWLDDELAQLEIEPLYVEDFTHFLNRTIFDLLDDFRFEQPDGDLAIYMADQDAHIYEHFQFLWEYARNFEAEKPKHIQFHHLQRDVVTNLIRLRLEHNRETQRQLEISLGETSESDELRSLSRRFQALLAERKKLEIAMVHYSQSARWVNNHRTVYATR
jgi:DNA primase